VNIPFKKNTTKRPAGRERKAWTWRFYFVGFALVAHYWSLAHTAKA
jgi:hypothetical protein